jgi:hypothetical protein
MIAIRDRPMAAHGLLSYRYKGRYGWVMIGASDHLQALKEAQRSTADPVTPDRLQFWDGQQYSPI